MSSELIERKLRADLDAAAEQHMPVMVVTTDYLRGVLDQIAKLQAELAEARDELRRLTESIWRAEYRQEAPEWKPLPDLIGMITQMDNMYAGVRSQRDQARWDLTEAREVPGRIMDWLNERISSAPKDQYSRGACDVFKLVVKAIEARDWSKP